MSKFLDSRFNKISYLTPPLFLHLISPQKLTSLGVESEGRFRRVASYVFGIQKRLLLSRDFDGPDGPKFDVRARGFPALLSACRRAGCCPFRCSLRSAPGGHPPAAGLGRAVSASRVRFRPSSQSSPCSPCGLCVAPGCSGRPLTLPHPSKRAYGPLRASWIRSSGLPGPQGTE